TDNTIVKDKTIERCFMILGLEPSASEEEAREARNFATQAFHPDKYAAGSKEQAKAHKKQIEINEAYAELRLWFNQNRRNAQQLANSESQGPSSSPQFGSRATRQIIARAIKLIFI